MADPDGIPYGDCLGNYLEAVANQRLRKRVRTEPTTVVHRVARFFGSLWGGVESAAGSSSGLTGGASSPNDDAESNILTPPLRTFCYPLLGRSESGAYFTIDTDILHPRYGVIHGEELLVPCDAYSVEPDDAAEGASRLVVVGERAGKLYVADVLDDCTTLQPKVRPPSGTRLGPARPLLEEIMGLESREAKSTDSDVSVPEIDVVRALRARRVTSRSKRDEGAPLKLEEVSLPPFITPSVKSFLQFAPDLEVADAETGTTRATLAPIATTARCTSSPSGRRLVIGWSGEDSTVVMATEGEGSVWTTSVSASATLTV